MPRRPNITRGIRLELQIPEDLRVKLDLHLWSALEGRVPHSAYTKLIVQLLNDYFDKLAIKPQES